MREDTAFIQKSENNEIEHLLNEVREKTPNPEDYYEIAATIESLGWNDSSVSETFGVEDIFELSRIIWDMINNKAYMQPLAEEESSFISTKLEIVRSFLRGLIFSLPMAISVVSMLTLKLSLWSYENLSTELATSIALGTILSFLTVGGYTQIIARRGFYYLSQGFYNMGKRVTYSFVKMGYITSFAVAIILMIINIFFNYIPFKMMIVAALYYLFLCSIWLQITITYLLKKELIFTGLLCMGILSVFILFEVFKLDIILSQIASLFVISIISSILIRNYFNKDEKNLEKGIAPSPPRNSVLIYTLFPYFLYGFLYFAFLFIDRIMAWSTDGNYMPYIIWFRGSYELGLDFALLMLMIPMGVIEVAVSRLMMRLDILLKNSFYSEEKSINKDCLNLYIKNIIYVSISAVLSSLFVFLIALLLNNTSLLKNSKFVFNYITYFVFIAALIGYSILSVALSNVSILFSLSQPNMVIKAIKHATLLNFFVSFTFSRWFNYYFAVLGLLAGTIYFCTATSYLVVKVLSNLDYYLYAAS